MSMASPIEQEGKWRLTGEAHAERLRAALVAQGAVFQGVDEELNRLFDRDGELRARSQVLRLRTFAGQSRAVLTWKGKARRNGKLKSRAEQEVGVDDAGTVMAILAGIGFAETMVYPKTRENWLLGGAAVSIDRLPFGLFCEIEGDLPEIARVADLLGLTDAHAERRGYPALMRAFLKR
ncbi:MAG: class IV adenylate cyclase [Chloroflexi bacterium]|nr:class IV adenylate cyclase [Chloroflexota bacterium]